MSNQCVTASPHVRSSGKVRNMGETPIPTGTDAVPASRASTLKRYDSFSSAEISIEEIPEIPQVIVPKNKVVPKVQPGSFNVSNRRKRFIKMAKAIIDEQYYHDVGDIDCDHIANKMAITNDQLRLIYPTPEIVLRTKKYEDGIFGNSSESYSVIKDMFFKDVFFFFFNYQSFLQSFSYDVICT